MTVLNPIERDDEWVLRMSALEEGGSLEVGGLLGRVQAVQSDAARHSLGKFVELSRRQLRQTLEEFASNAQISLGDLLALETGEGGAHHSEAISRLAAYLRIDADPLLELAGAKIAANQRLGQAALEFAARTEPVAPLDAQEAAALKRFREDAWAGNVATTVEG
jgi:transcriptional regulator with XRE-family HTH domain